MATTTIEEWLDRVQNVLDVQKDLGINVVEMHFTRNELVNLRTILKFAKEKKDETV